MELVLSPLVQPPADHRPVEVVERKGRGHPDTICDALAEELSLALGRFYRDRLGVLLHHNVDKALLWGGAARPAFGGGEVLRPMEIFLAGRAVLEAGGVTVPIDDLARETVHGWLGRNLHALEPERHVVVHSLVRPGSADLLALFERRRETGTELANDTSCGVGFAPASELERIVLAVESRLSGKSAVEAHPALGEDVKVLGVRRGERIRLTVAAAVVGRFTPDLGAYLATKSTIEELARETARELTSRDVEVEVNCADRPGGADAGGVYLTVTGTSAEAGDDGQVGRGNRVGGLITPGRPMVMEAAAGKNPVTHVGKLYNALAHRLAARLVAELPDVAEAECLLASRIGHPVHRPPLVEVRLRAPNPAALRAEVEALVLDELDRLEELREDLLAGTVALY